MDAAPLPSPWYSWSVSGIVVRNHSSSHAALWTLHIAMWPCVALLCIRLPNRYLGIDMARVPCEPEQSPTWVMATWVMATLVFMFHGVQLSQDKQCEAGHRTLIATSAGATRSASECNTWHHTTSAMITIMAIVTITTIVTIVTYHDYRDPFDYRDIVTITTIVTIMTFMAIMTVMTVTTIVTIVNTLTIVTI